MSGTSGSIRKLTIEGISYDVAADANFSEDFSGYENEREATSGASMLRKTKKVQMLEGVVLKTNAQERIQLNSFAAEIEDIKISYTNANGDEYKCNGSINIESNETESNRTTISVSASTAWTPFPA